MMGSKCRKHTDEKYHLLHTKTNKRKNFGFVMLNIQCIHINTHTHTHVGCSESKERLLILISCPATQPSMLMPTVLHFDVFVRLFRTAAGANCHVALF